MSWTPTDEQVEKAVEAWRGGLGFGDTPLASLTPDARNAYMRQMRAVLVAVGPTIAADACDLGIRLGWNKTLSGYQFEQIKALNPYRQEAGR